jgi:hypothetical protein
MGNALSPVSWNLTLLFSIVESGAEAGRWLQFAEASGPTSDSSASMILSPALFIAWTAPTGTTEERVPVVESSFGDRNAFTRERSIRVDAMVGGGLATQHPINISQLICSEIRQGGASLNLRSYKT